jgi:hypothetical protein
MAKFKFKWFRSIAIATPIVLVLLGGAVIRKLYVNNNINWLRDYFFGTSQQGDDGGGMTDIIFLVVDHFEPGGNTSVMNTWMTEYRRLASKHVDSDGNKLQHDWCYPIEQFRGNEVDSLVQLCREGYGDIGIHFHHKNDTQESFLRVLTAGIDSLQAHGALVSSDRLVHFPFVHGNWALDNSIDHDGKNLCGVNDEISLLVENGCFADCTFPAMGSQAQPSLVNKLYYAVDDPTKPKSYDKGPLSQVGTQGPRGGLLLIEGPMMIDWTDWQFRTHPTFDDGDLYWEIPTTFHRFECWLKANVHVVGRTNWVFVRPFTHGAHLREEGALDNILGFNMDRMLSEAEQKYRDDKRYRLHYMTAREAYNVIRAAEDGRDGNPNDYRDYIIKPFLYEIDTTRKVESAE